MWSNTAGYKYLSIYDKTVLRRGYHNKAIQYVQELDSSKC